MSTNTSLYSSAAAFSRQRDVGWSHEYFAACIDAENLHNVLLDTAEVLPRLANRGTATVHLAETKMEIGKVDAESIQIKWHQRTISPASSSTA